LLHPLPLPVPGAGSSRIKGPPGKAGDLGRGREKEMVENNS